MKDVVLKPRLSEKAYQLSEDTSRTYIFEVPASANKHSISKAVGSQYEVEIQSVRVAGVYGKPQRTVKKGGRRIHKSRRPDIRKAYVTLKEGHKLPIFAAVEEPAKDAQKPKEKK